MVSFSNNGHGRDNLVQPLPDGTSNTPEIYIVEIPLDCTTADTFRNDQSPWDGLTWENRSGERSVVPLFLLVVEVVSKMSKKTKHVLLRCILEPTENNLT